MTKIILLKKQESGELQKLDEQLWDDIRVEMLNLCNYLMLKGTEYEMVEGRLNLDDNALELLLVEAKRD